MSLVSNLDHETYPVKLDVKFVGQKQQITVSSLKRLENHTDLTVSVYVHSSNPHWTAVTGVATSLRPQSHNPFEQSSKLTSLLPGKVYYLPLALSTGCKVYLKSKDIRYTNYLRKPNIFLRSSLSENFFMVDQLQFDDHLITCKSNQTKSTIFRVGFHPLYIKVFCYTGARNCRRRYVMLSNLTLHGARKQSSSDFEDPFQRRAAQPARETKVLEGEDPEAFPCH